MFARSPMTVILKLISFQTALEFTNIFTNIPRSEAVCLTFRFEAVCLTFHSEAATDSQDPGNKIHIYMSPKLSVKCIKQQQEATRENICVATFEKSGTVSKCGVKRYGCENDARVPAHFWIERRRKREKEKERESC